MLRYNNVSVPSGNLYVPLADTLAPNTPTAAALEPRRDNVVDQIGRVLSGAGISVSVDGSGVHVVDTDRNSPLFGTTLPTGVSPTATTTAIPFYQNPLFLIGAAAVGVYLIAKKG